MLQAISIMLPSSRHDLSIGQALIIIEEQFIDAAITSLSHATEDGRGLAWHVIPKAEFR